LLQELKIAHVPRRSYRAPPVQLQNDTTCFTAPNSTFDESPAGKGSLNFNINFEGKVANSIYYNVGGSNFEDAQWKHFLLVVKELCIKGG
jgi:hypothetical protein